jgi:crossover junction endodeoxyribonuclease RuvC
VREKAIGHTITTINTIMVLNKVVGVSDLYAWGFGKRVFEEIDPRTVKKLITGDGKADKETVAAALEKYVGPQTYRVDDWSDAVAVGVAW